MLGGVPTVIVFAVLERHAACATRAVHIFAEFLRLTATQRLVRAFELRRGLHSKLGESCLDHVSAALIDLRVEVESPHFLLLFKLPDSFQLLSPFLKLLVKLFEARRQHAVSGRQRPLLLHVYVPA